MAEMTDLILASLHHLMVFMLVAILAAEWVILRPSMPASSLGLLARIDSAYGAIAMAVILVGIGRVFYGLKGWEFYIYNPTFWTKMAAFAAVGLLSIVPTIRIVGWRRAAAGNRSFAVTDEAILSVRRFLRAEIAVFALIPVVAAALARGHGY